MNAFADYRIVCPNCPSFSGRLNDSYCDTCPGRPSDPVELTDGLRFLFDDRIWRVTQRIINGSVTKTIGESGIIVLSRIKNEEVVIIAVPDAEGD
jgi:hypothetical protein